MLGLQTYLDMPRFDTFDREVWQNYVPTREEIQRRYKRVFNRKRKAKQKARLQAKQARRRNR